MTELVWELTLGWLDVNVWDKVVTDWTDGGNVWVNGGGGWEEGGNGWGIGIVGWAEGGSGRVGSFSTGAR